MLETSPHIEIIFSHHLQRNKYLLQYAFREGFELILSVLEAMYCHNWPSDLNMGQKKPKILNIKFFKSKIYFDKHTYHIFIL